MRPGPGGVGGGTEEGVRTAGFPTASHPRSEHPWNPAANPCLFIMKNSALAHAKSSWFYLSWFMQQQQQKGEDALSKKQPSDLRPLMPESSGPLSLLLSNLNCPLRLAEASLTAAYTSMGTKPLAPQCHQQPNL